MSTAVPITVRGDVDERAVAQLERCAQAGEALRGVLCADGHVGYSQPIGGAIAYPDHISPSGVGYDIACGNKAVRTDLLVDDVLGRIGGVMDEIQERISFGMGRRNDEPVDHPVLDEIRAAPFAPQRGLLDLAAAQLGTVGAGNHYVDLFAGDDDHVWVGVHFGSRGFGHRTASGFLALAQGLGFGDRAAEGEMDAPPVLLHVDSELGRSYIEAMRLAGEYAYAGRDTVVAKVLEILGAEATYEVHNHHNFAWRERHFDTDVWVVRKGCTPAFPGQEGFVGATMGEPSVILRGTESGGARPALQHRPRRGPGHVAHEGGGQGAPPLGVPALRLGPGAPGSTSLPTGAARRAGTPARAARSRSRPGQIDFDDVRARLAAGRIELRGGAADEAPAAYKRLGAVLAAHEGTIEVVHRLAPIGVAMAGADTFDAYKD